MYGCFWCSVQGHLIKGECTPVTGGQCQPVSGLLSLARNKVTIRKQAPSESCMHAPCSLQLTVCVCVCVCVFKEITAVKDPLCQFGGPLYAVVQICSEIFAEIPDLLLVHITNCLFITQTKRILVCVSPFLLLRPIRHFFPQRLRLHCC